CGRPDHSCRDDRRPAEQRQTGHPCNGSVVRHRRSAGSGRVPDRGNEHGRRPSHPAPRRWRPLQPGIGRRFGHRSIDRYSAGRSRCAMTRDPSMNFCSDNVTGVAPEIMAALAAANHGPAMGYGNDDITCRVEKLVAEAFGTDVAVFPVATGTAANALALSVMAPAYVAIY